MLLVVIMLILIAYYYMSRDILVEDDVFLKQILTFIHKWISKAIYWIAKIILILFVYTIPIILIILIFSSKRGEQAKSLNQGINSLSRFIGRVTTTALLGCVLIYLAIQVPQYVVSQNLTLNSLLVFTLFIVQIVIILFNLYKYVQVIKAQEALTANRNQIIKDLRNLFVIKPLIGFMLVYMFSGLISISGMSLNIDGTQPINLWLTISAAATTIISYTLYNWLSVLEPVNYQSAPFNQVFSIKKFIVVSLVITGSLLFVMPELAVDEQINTQLVVIGMILLLVSAITQGLANYRFGRLKKPVKYLLVITSVILALSMVVLEPVTYVPYGEERHITTQYEPVTLQQAIDVGTINSAQAISVECNSEEDIKQFIEMINSGKLDNVEFLAIDWYPDKSIDLSQYPAQINIDLTSLKQLKQLYINSAFALVPLSVDVTNLDNLEYMDIRAVNDDQNVSLTIDGMDSLTQLKYLAIDADDGAVQGLAMPFVENDYCYVVNNIEECNIDKEPDNYTFKYLRNNNFEQGEMVPSIKQLKIMGATIQDTGYQDFMKLVKDYQILVEADYPEGWVYKWNSETKEWQLIND